MWGQWKIKVKIFGKYNVGTVAYIADVALQCCIFCKKQKNGNIILAAVVGTVAYIVDIALQYRIFCKKTKKWKYNFSSS